MCILDEIITIICEGKGAASDFWKEVVDKLFQQPDYSPYENDNEFQQLTCSQKLLKYLKSKLVTWDHLSNCLVQMRRSDLKEKCLNESRLTVGK